MKFSLLLLLLLSSSTLSHESIFTAGYIYNGGVTLGYHSTHRVKGEFGYYGNIFYSDSNKNYMDSTTLETVITEFVSETTTTTETVSLGRAVKCNKHGKCHAYGPERYDTITTEISTTSPIDIIVSEDIYFETKHREKALALNLGLNYSLSEDIFIYGGAGILQERHKTYFSNTIESFNSTDTNYKGIVNVGLLLSNKDNFGLNFGWVSGLNEMYVGLSYQF